ncbi:MAG: RND transporter [Thermodesulfobacteriota bacterium]
MRALFDSIPWPLVVVLCLTLGLAPFRPPHLVEKLRLLSHGELVRPLDWFDLFLHASPWLLLAGKILSRFDR